MFPRLLLFCSASLLLLAGLDVRHQEQGAKSAVACVLLPTLGQPPRNFETMRTQTARVPRLLCRTVDAGRVSHWAIKRKCSRARFHEGCFFRSDRRMVVMEVGLRAGARWLHGLAPEMDRGTRV